MSFARFRTGALAGVLLVATGCGGRSNEETCHYERSDIWLPRCIGDEPSDEITAVWVGPQDWETIIVWGTLGGRVLRTVGSRRPEEIDSLGASIRALTVAEDGLAWACGDDGLLARGSPFPNQVWEIVPSDLTSDCVAIAADAAGITVFAVDGGLLRQAGDVWELQSGQGEGLRDVATGAHLWATGPNGVYQYAADRWQLDASAPSIVGHAVAVGPEGTVWVAGEQGQMATRQGGEWRAVESGTMVTLRDVWVGSEGEAWVVGEGGTVFRVSPQHPHEVSPELLPEDSVSSVSHVGGLEDKVTFVAGESCFVYATSSEATVCE